VACLLLQHAAHVDDRLPSAANSAERVTPHHVQLVAATSSVHRHDTYAASAPTQTLERRVLLPAPLLRPPRGSHGHHAHLRAVYSELTLRRQRRAECAMLFAGVETAAETQQRQRRTAVARGRVDSARLLRKRRHRRAHERKKGGCEATAEPRVRGVSSQGGLGNPHEGSPRFQRFSFQPRHRPGRERMGSPTLQTLQDPILLLAWLCFRGGGFRIPNSASALTLKRDGSWLSSSLLVVCSTPTKPSLETIPGNPKSLGPEGRVRVPEESWWCRATGMRRLRTTPRKCVRAVSSCAHPPEASVSEPPNHAAAFTTLTEGPPSTTSRVATMHGATRG
jgi:hypothetical protein